MEISQSNNQIHGHEVMHMMQASGKNYTRETLKSDIIEKFGESTRFYTCSAENLTADGLIEFLASRNKFSGDEDAFQLGTEGTCDHE